MNENKHELISKENEDKKIECPYEECHSLETKHRKRWWYTLGLGIYGGLIFGVSFISGIIWSEWRINKKIGEYDQESSYKGNNNAINKQQGANNEK